MVCARMPPIASPRGVRYYSGQNGLWVRVLRFRRWGGWGLILVPAPCLWAGRGQTDVSHGPRLSHRHLGERGWSAGELRDVDGANPGRVPVVRHIQRAGSVRRREVHHLQPLQHTATTKPGGGRAAPGQGREALGLHAAGHGRAVGRELAFVHRAGRVGRELCAYDCGAGNGDLLVTTFDGKVLEFANDRFRALPSPAGEAGKGYLGYADETGRWWALQPAFVGMWDGERWAEPISLPPAAPEQLSWRRPVTGDCGSWRVRNCAATATAKRWPLCTCPMSVGASGA